MVVTPAAWTTVTLSVTIGGDPGTWERRLRQYALQPDTTLTTLVGTPARPWEVFTGATVTVSPTQSSFIRAEVWDSLDGMPLAFGQAMTLNRV